MPTVVRGKALVAKLRANPKVRDAEALAAWLGRVKRLKKGGLSAKQAMKAAGKGGASAKKPLPKTAAQKAREEYDPDDPFTEDFGPNEEETPEQKRQRKMEEAILRKMEQEDRSNLYRAIHDQGGIKTRNDLREEYREIPNNLKRKDGMSGDEMAEHLCTHFAELGICSENDLLQYFRNRAA